MSLDLSTLPPPEVVEPVDFEILLAERKARFIALAYQVSAEFGAEAEALMQLESEPAVKLLEEASYDGILLRQRINEAALAVLLATARGANLEHIAALYGVQRLITHPGNPDALPPIDPTWETDDALRARVQMAPEGFSTAGPAGAYRFHALSAAGEIYDASVDSPSPGVVRVTLLPKDGVDLSPALLATVDTALNAEDVRPLTDEVVVAPAEFVDYAITASLTTYPGPSPAVALDDARISIVGYAHNCYRLGYDVTLSGIYAALHRPGVQRVNLISPATDIVCDTRQAPRCTAINLTLDGTDV